MSIINQVLQDLERRQVSEASDSAAILHRVHAVPTRAKHSPKIKMHIIRVLVAMLLLLVVVFGYLKFDRAIAQPVTEPLVSVPSNTVQPLPDPPLSQSKQSPPAVADISQTSVGAKTTVTEPKTDSVPVAPTQKSPTSSKTIKSVEIAKIDAAVPVESDTSTQVIQKRPLPMTMDQQSAQRYEQAYAMIEQQRLRDAEALLRSALQDDPRQIRLRELLVGLYIRSGRWVEAESILERGVKENPHYGVFIKLHARALMQLQQDQRAILVLTTHQIDMNVDPDHHALLAALYQRQNQHAQAAEIYTQLLKNRPSAGVWWVGLGISLEAMSKHAQAQSAYQQARSSGNLPTEVVRYTDNRLQAMTELRLNQE